jgi:hypothetical protein
MKGYGGSFIAPELPCLLLLAMEVLDSSWPRILCQNRRLYDTMQYSARRMSGCLLNNDKLLDCFQKYCG